MLLHHEAIVAAGSNLLPLLAWGSLAVNAAVFYLHKLIHWRKQMPCYSRQTSTVQFGEQTDRALFTKAVQNMGYVVRTSTDGTIHFVSDDVTAALKLDGSLSVTAAEGAFDVNTVKRAYSTEVVKSAAQRFGWQAKQTENKFVVQRRY